MIKKRKARILIYLLVSACIVVPLYILCHETGHAAVAYFCGADTIHISITGAYMNSSGGSYNRVTSAMLNIAGMLFPAVISIIYLLLYKREKGSLFLPAVFLFARGCFFHAGRCVDFGACALHAGQSTNGR